MRFPLVSPLRHFGCGKNRVPERKSPAFQALTNSGKRQPLSTPAEAAGAAPPGRRLPASALRARAGDVVPRQSPEKRSPENERFRPDESPSPVAGVPRTSG